jgi:hypothetical protein
MSSNLTRVVVWGTLACGTLVIVAMWPPVALGGIAAGLVIWQLSRCRHTPPLALLPPTLDEHGERQPARWYCDRCGKTWTAVFEHDRVPIQRFTGYDQTKAAAAAKRAAELAERQQALALKRAGFARTTPVARKVQEPAAAVRPNPPVPIHGRRIAG